MSALFNLQCNGFTLQNALQQTQAALTNTPVYAPSPNPNGGVLPQVEAGIAQGGYVETEQNYPVFGFVDGRLSVIGHDTNVTMVIPTHNQTGLKSSRVPEPQLNTQAPGTGPDAATLQEQLDQTDQALSAAKAQDPSSANALALQQKAAGIASALSQVQIAPGSYGSPPDLTGMITNTAA